VTLGRLLSVVAGWAALSVALWVSDARPAVLVLGGVVAVIGAAVFIALDMADAVDEVEWTRRSRRQAIVRPADMRVSAIRRRAQGSWWSGASDIGDTLVDLIDDRLLANHRVDRAVDPAAASAVLTPALRALVDAPRRSSISPRELQQLLTDIEAL
jgi:hypothetical protein